MLKQHEVKALSEAVAIVVREYVREYVAEAQRKIAEQLDAIERRFAELPTPKDGQDGRNAFEVAVSLGYEGTVYDWMESLQGEDGKSVTLEDLGPVVEKSVSDAIAAIPPPKDGKDGTSVSIDDIRPLLDEAIAALPPPPAGPKGNDGTSLTLDDVRPLIEEAVAAIPRPKDGKSVTAEEVVALLRSEIVEWELDFERRAQGVLERAVDRLPKPKDGVDGRDALQVEDFEFSLGEDQRTVTIGLRRGEAVALKAVKFPTVIYRGVWTEAAVYERFDSVTFGGNQWIALTDDPGGKPGISKDWQLSVKKGRDGRDRRNGAAA